MRGPHTFVLGASMGTFLIIGGLTLSGPEYFDMPKGRGGGLIVPADERWPLMASVATEETSNQSNIAPDIFLYL